MQIKHVRKHEPAWHLIDANDLVLGRLSTKVADLLRGKGKVSFLQHMDCGDHVVVINASKVVMTGNKLMQKNYYRHSWHPGGLKTTSAEKMMAEKPEYVIEHSVSGMLPKNKLHKLWMQRLHVYAGSEHPHQANIAGEPKAAAKSDKE